MDPALSTPTSYDTKDITYSYWLLATLLITMLSVLTLPDSLQFLWIRNNYLPIHTVLEFSAVLISFAIFTLGWATYRTVRSSNILFLSATSFSVGWLDLAHSLSYTGMPDFVTASGNNKAIYFWLASRLTDSFALLLVAVLMIWAPNFSRFSKHVLLLATLWTILVYVMVLLFPDQLPFMFVPGQGLTPIKVSLEIVVVLVSLIAGVLFYWQIFKAKHPQDSYSKAVTCWLGCGCLVFAMTSVFFLLYREIDELYVFVGHIFKAIGFCCIGRAVFIECVSRPYEQMQTLATQASQASQAKVRFLANVSHEFRTPLGVISGFSDLLTQSKCLDNESKEWAGTIQRNADQLRFLVDDLLDLAKVEHDTIDVHWTHVDLNELLCDTISSFSKPLQARGIEFKIMKHPEVPATIGTDQLRLKQILNNLLSNASKFTKKGSINLEIFPDVQDFVLFKVSDTGIGIDPEKFELLFRPFSQVDDSKNRQIGGTGLGLALAKRLAQLLGGDLWLQESCPGKGSTLAFRVMDNKKAPTATTPQPQDSSLISDLHAFKILVAEDSIDNQFLIRRYLQSTKATITIVNNGLEALELIKSGNFDLILMDIQMPEMDGFEATEKIRSHGWTGPIVALTAHAHLPERERALSNGFTAYLVKPINRSELYRTLQMNLL